MNPPLVLLVYVLCLAAAFLSTFGAYRLSKTYGYPYLAHFMLYTLAANLIVVLESLLKSVAPALLRSRELSARHIFTEIFPFILLPLIAFFLYQFTAFAQALRDKTPSARFKWGYTGFWLLFFSLFIGLEIHYFNGGDYARVRLLIPVFDIAVLFFCLLALHHLWQGRREALTPIRRKLCTAMLVIFLVIFLAVFINSSIFFHNIGPIGSALLGTIACVFPVVFLWRFLRRHEAPAAPQPAPVEYPIPAIAERYGLSKREEEILVLLLQGRSNRQIEEELFISLRTVEGHVYKIYRKMGVKNRLQLIHLLHDQGRTILL